MSPWCRTSYGRTAAWLTRHNDFRNMTRPKLDHQNLQGRGIIIMCASFFHALSSTFIFNATPSIFTSPSLHQFFSLEPFFFCGFCKSVFSFFAWATFYLFFSWCREWATVPDCENWITPFEIYVLRCFLPCDHTDRLASWHNIIGEAVSSPQLLNLAMLNVHTSEMRWLIFKKFVSLKWIRRLF